MEEGEREEESCSARAGTENGTDAAIGTDANATEQASMQQGGQAQAVQPKAAAAPPVSGAAAAPADSSKPAAAGDGKRADGAPKTTLASEAENTDKMRQHQMMRKQVAGSTMKHEDVDLMVCTDLIDKSSRTSVLNAADGYCTLLEVLAANPDEKALVSDVDPQILMKVNFKEKANLSQIIVRFAAAPKLKDEDADEVVSKPRLIKVFANMDELDFGDVEDTGATATQVIEDPNAVEMKLACIGHKFQRLQSVQILIDEAQDAEATRTFINRVQIIGHQAPTYDYK